MSQNNEPGRKKARTTDPEYQQALAERKAAREQAKRDGTPEPPHIRHDPKTGEIVESKRSQAEIRLSAAKRAAKAAEMRVQRYPWDTIAEKLGYKNGPTARMSVQKFMDRIPMESVETLRQSELESLDIAEVALAERIRNGDIKAIEAMLKIKQHRARLAGLYAETPVSAIDAELLLVQTTTSVLHLVRTHPDMPAEEIVASLMATATAITAR